MVKISKRKQRQQERNWSPPQIETLTKRQATYLELLNRYDCNIAAGVAGTGKTYVACAWAGAELHAKTFQQIILTRPNVGVGRTLGLLPGRVEQKMAPWARPLIAAFKAQMSAKKYDEAVNAKQIEIQPLEHIRGLTFDNACMIIDEAQNTTPAEMKAFLTRIGENSSVIICGDERQSDIGKGNNGLAWAMRAHDQGLVPDVGLVQFQPADVVRSELCKQWGEAFETMEDEEAAGSDYRGGLHKLVGGELL